MNKRLSFIFAFFFLFCLGLPNLYCEEKGQICLPFDLDKETSSSEKLVWAKAFIFQGLHMIANEKNPKYKEDKQNILKDVAAAILELKDQQ